MQRLVLQSALQNVLSEVGQPILGLSLTNGGLAKSYQLSSLSKDLACSENVKILAGLRFA